MTQKPQKQPVQRGWGHLLRGCFYCTLGLFGLVAADLVTDSWGDFGLFLATLAQLLGLPLFLYAVFYYITLPLLLWLIRKLDGEKKDE